MPKASERVDALPLAPSTGWRHTEHWLRAARTIHQLDALEGRWSEGKVYGRLVDAGWGAGLGYPALRIDPDGSAIRVHVFESTQLPDHWSRLDEFEGPGYQRVVASVTTAAGEVIASIYILRDYLESSCQR